MATVTMGRDEPAPWSPRDTIAAYFHALADRDADTARSLLSRDVANTAPMPLTSGAALRDPGYHPPGRLKITKLEVRGDVATVEGDYEVDGERRATLLTLIHEGGTGEARPWRINSLPSLPPPTGEYGFEALLIAGTQMPSGSIEYVFHGSYLVTLPDHLIREVVAPVTVRTGDREAGALRVRMRESARQSVEAQVRTYLERCTASRELAPRGCPFSAYSPTPVRDVVWKIAQHPAIEIALGSTYSIEVTSTFGTATVTARDGSGVFTESSSFSVLGHATATTSKILFMPR
ncbi:hypothetical protein OG470_09265 [Micromonospora sp. NBC_00389]|uniref:nuclear transport factor 2 family protein n=1 Tax=Micromonospora sp. NBC_00389 TaxID=2903586 RepID=UPI002E1CC6CA